MTPMLLGTITRQLRRITGLARPIYLVGGSVSEGATLRDLDFVVNDKRDINKIRECLGKYAPKAHFILQKNPPTASMFVRFTGKEVGLTGKKSGKIPANEYAGPLTNH